MIDFNTFGKKNILLLITVVISTSIFFYVNFFDAIFLLIITFFILKCIYLLKNKCNLWFKKLFTFCFLLYILFEIFSVFLLFINSTKFSLLAFICVLLLITRLSFVSKENIKIINQIIIFLIILYVLSLPLCFFKSFYPIDIKIDFEFKNIYIIFSLVFFCLIIKDYYNVGNKEFNIGYFIGTLFYLIIILVQNVIFGNNYSLKIHPIIALSSYMIFPIEPLSEWFILYLIVVRESIIIKYGLDTIKKIKGRYND